MNVAKSCMGVKSVSQAECHRHTSGQAAQESGKGDPIHASCVGHFAEVDPGRFRERQHRGSKQEPGEADGRHVLQPKAKEQRCRRTVPRQKQCGMGLGICIFTV